MSEGDESRNDSFLPYLNLLHEDAPRNVLDTFLSLLEDHSVVRKIGSPEDPADFDVDEHFEFDGDSAGEWRGFLRWWIDQYNREVARKFDSLTGLYSRSYWSRQLRPEFLASEDSYTVVLGDIDHFKRFNDRYGHAVGDRVLSAVGTVLRDVFEPEGVCVRYGGEELLVLDSGPVEEVRDRAEAFREGIQGDLFEDQPETVSVSQGISRPRDDGRALEERIEEADLALYASKNRGRDRVTTFAPYMRHRESLSVWGFYRYFWGSGLRFCFGADNDTFFLYYDGVLKEYRWGDDAVGTVPLPDSVQGVEELLFRDGRLYLLDPDGNLLVGGSDGWEPATRDEVPPLTTLLDAGDQLLAAAANNQLYRVGTESTERLRSLPDRWERLFYLGEPTAVVDGQLRTLGDPPRFWDLPEAYVDFSVGDEELVMSSKGGNLYVFDRNLDHWKEMKLPDFLNHRVDVRNIERGDDNLLIHDANGRFFLASKRHKSVPQRMDFEY